ncbi:class II fructose-bisphosphate aldolase family protein [Clostridium sp. D2Q-14]|uniref:class II fructose-bisphosphate aldolase n=1 Tax=Anaeromonas gelatinilytica TaxID=2683194 RepID=UPI00193C3716|nr:class II fructose-bisphosphate aldolase [Anaeromonas gelatinilytica]MBS4535644.1 class II fructose-bisphosphate aldolase family protein [Anaeromonas gelatinilytica]
MYVSMKQILDRANRENYAVMAINCFNLETSRTVINAAEEYKAPIIINIVQDHLETHAPSNLIAPIVKDLAEKVSVPVALNFDHGKDKKLLYKAIEDGFTSIMYDGSDFNLEQNIMETKEMVEYAHKRGISVEAELGSLGATEGEGYTSNDMKTNPEEAENFVKRTGIDALAISYGSSHGNYPKGMVPEFDFERLKEIKKKIDIPLVLHGGSGSGEENIRKSVEYGINKINVGCDFMNANRASIHKILKQNPDINFFDMMHQVEKDNEEIIKYYIELSGSKYKA